MVGKISSNEAKAKKGGPECEPLNKNPQTRVSSESGHWGESENLVSAENVSMVREISLNKAKVRTFNAKDDRAGQEEHPDVKATF